MNARNKFKLVDEKRTKLIEQIKDVVLEAAASDDNILLDAVLYGRVGLHQMNDTELVEAAEVWQVEVDHD